MILYPLEHHRKSSHTTWCQWQSQLLQVSLVYQDKFTFVCSYRWGKYFWGESHDHHHFPCFGLHCGAENHCVNWDPLRWNWPECSPGAGKHPAYGSRPKLIFNKLSWNAQNVAFESSAPRVLLYRAVLIGLHVLLMQAWPWEPRGSQGQTEQLVRRQKPCSRRGAR